jgi:hypothetical protein
MEGGVGVGHDDGDAGGFEHVEIVEVVADGHDLVPD